MPRAAYGQVTGAHVTVRRISRLAHLRFSLRQVIALLGVLVVIVATAAITLAVLTLRNSQSAIIANDQVRIRTAAHLLAKAYANKLGAVRFTGVQDKSQSANSGAGSSANNDVAEFAGLAQTVLAGEDAAAGGYYSAATGAVNGYAPPPGPKPRGKTGHIPPPDRHEIERVAHQAVATGEEATGTRMGPADVLLLHAVPISYAGRVIGSAWVMKHVAEPLAGRRSRAGAVSLVVVGGALLCALLALATVRRLQRGIEEIERGIGALGEDLGARVHAEREFTELERIGSAVNRMAAELAINQERERQTERQLRDAERLAALGRMSAGVAHEVRNPLATMRLRAQLLATADGDAATLRSAQLIIQEIDRLNALVGRLLTFAKPLALTSAGTDIFTLVQERIEHQSDRAKGLGVAFVLHPPQMPAYAQVDASMLAQVFDNVIRNALDAMSHGGTLEACVDLVAGGVRVVFHDNGPGVDAAVRERLFEPFVTTRADGTGLGLAISHELVRAHGGQISVSSMDNTGTTVTVTLPATGQALS